MLSSSQRRWAPCCAILLVLVINSVLLAILVSRLGISGTTIKDELPTGLKDAQEGGDQVQDVQSASLNNTIRGLYGLTRSDRVMSDSWCEAKFGLTALERWNNAGEVFVSAQIESSEALVRCRVTLLDDQPVATQPHTICNATDLVLDTAKLSPADCPAYRPGYQCVSPPTFYHYAPGAVTFSRACKKEESFTLKSFPKDHLLDIFSSLECNGKRDSPFPVLPLGGVTNVQRPSSALDGVTLLITREKGEHFNLFHASTDWLNAFMVISILDLPLDQISVVILDDHTPSNLDIVWDAVFSKQRPTVRIGDLKGRLKFDQAVFVPPGYSSLLYKGNEDGLRCDAGSDGVSLWRAFSRHVLASFGIAHRFSNTKDSVKVLLVLRKPYSIGSLDHNFVGRQIDNEDEVKQALEGIPGTKLSVVDLASMPFREQVAAVSSTDILIGMHGAGLMHTFWLPLHGGLLEIRPRNNMGWLCFRNLAMLIGVHYREYVNDRFPLDYREDPNGDYTTVDVDRFTPKVLELISRIRKRNPRIN